jgi:hypothetical protein
LLAQGRWFSPGTPASSTTKTGRHDIAEILLKMALKHQKRTTDPGQATGKLYYLRLRVECTLFVIYHREEDLKKKAMFINGWEHTKNQNQIYGRFCIKFPQSRMKGERHRLSPLSL